MFRLKIALIVGLRLVSILDISVVGDVEGQTCVVGNDNDTCHRDASSSTQKIAPTGTPKSCKDEDERCGYWASIGECAVNPSYMHVGCRLSCELCIADGEDKVESEIDVGVTQVLEDANFRVTMEKAQGKLLESRAYMESLEFGGFSEEVKRICRNEHEMCTVWALAGECDKNPVYMKKVCAPSCRSCDYLSIAKRCPPDRNALNTWGPGDLDKMFTRLVNNPYLSQYEVQILSSPSMDGPWVITMENFVSEAEANRLIELGAVEGYKRSLEVGNLRPDGTVEEDMSESRTSTHAWCQNDCYRDETALAVIQRISDVVGINETNSEYLQLLRYEPGQHYESHHDYLEHDLQTQDGVRILTVYLYLNDVEKGGGTNFDQLGITVLPKRGRALLWPSVLNDRPHEKDSRTSHQAFQVEAGVKYGANAWFHQRDFKTPHRNGCS